MSEARPTRQHVPTAAKWAAKVGYSRAVRVGAQIFVAGTAPVGEDGTIVHPGDYYRQTRRCCEIITAALRELGAGPEHVVRTRMYVVDATQWEDIGRAHAEFFGSAMPATAMIAVKGFVDPDMLVEIEADAIVA